MDGSTRTIEVSLEEEMKRSYLDYAMSVIIGRAIPDIKDGLNAMYEMGNGWNKPYKKSARIVGDVIGKYHPHGEAAAPCTKWVMGGINLTKNQRASSET